MGKRKTVLNRIGKMCKFVLAREKSRNRNETRNAVEEKSRRQKLKKIEQNENRYES